MAARRVISFIIEEVLAHPPAGDGAVDAVAWIEVLSDTPGHAALHLVQAVDETSRGLGG